MKKLMCVVSVLMMLGQVAYANPWSEQDKENEQVTNFVQSLVGEVYVEEINKLYPNCTLEWGARGMLSDELSLTYLVYVEITDDRQRQIGYQYIELVLNFVNGNPVLMNKYGIEEK